MPWPVQRQLIRLQVFGISAVPTTPLPAISGVVGEGTNLSQDQLGLDLDQEEHQVLIPTLACAVIGLHLVLRGPPPPPPRRAVLVGLLPFEVGGEDDLRLLR